MKHLSAESALYCRILTEGLLGMEPLGFDKVKLAPDLPADWDYLELKNIGMLGQQFDIKLNRVSKKIKVEIKNGDKIIFTKTIKPKEKISVSF